MASRAGNARSQLGLPRNDTKPAPTPFSEDHGEDVQMEMLRQQDEQLEHLALDVKRIGKMGEGIREELEDQTRLLDELDEDFSNTRTNMAAVHTKVRAFIQETGRGQLCTIVGLYMLFLVLLFLLLTT